MEWVLEIQDHWAAACTRPSRGNEVAARVVGMNNPGRSRRVHQGRTAGVLQGSHIRRCGLQGSRVREGRLGTKAAGLRVMNNHQVVPGNGTQNGAADDVVGR